MDTENNKKFLRAKKRVEVLKKYYIHLAIFITVIITTSIIKGVYGVREEIIYGGFDTFTIWIWWGIAVAFHTFKVFGSRIFLSKDWEDQKIKDYMDEK